MIPIVTPAEMGAIDAAAPEPVEVLIRRAGSAIATLARRMLGGTYGRVVTVVAGPGNNGADGTVAGELLAAAGVRVCRFAAGELPATLPTADLVIDAAYGTGFHGVWEPPPIGATPVLAVDIPSGIDGVTGEAGPAVWQAARTVTFAAVKPGLLLGRGHQLSGVVEVADIGLDVSAATAHVVEDRDVSRWWPRRAVDAHKWNAAVRVVAGSPGMTGAAHLVARAAQRAGAGIVVLSVPGEPGGGAIEETVGRAIPATGWSADLVDDDLPDRPGHLARFGALVVGPGLGRSDQTATAVRRVVAGAHCPVVIDGDALHAIAGDPEVVTRRAAPTILTPHDGEFAFLTGQRPAPDRFTAVRQLAAEWSAIVLLKGPTTLVAAPDGYVRVVADGDERLATAGSGDVLSGIIAAGLCAGADAFAAAAAGAWLHAAAGRALPRRGLVAGDLPDALPAALELLTP